jgi:hypothetical protein
MAASFRYKLCQFRDYKITMGIWDTAGQGARRQRGEAAALTRGRRSAMGYAAVLLLSQRGRRDRVLRCGWRRRRFARLMPAGPRAPPRADVANRDTFDSVGAGRRAPARREARDQSPSRRPACTQ